MRTALCAATILLAGVSLAQSQASPGDNRAKLYYNDVIEIQVFDQPKLSGDFKVLSDGSIDAARIGRIYVLGQTVVQVKGVVVQRLKKFLRNPDVDVVLRTQHEEAIFLLGGTELSGTVPFQHGMDLRSVIAHASALGEPDLTDITVFRDGHMVSNQTLQKLIKDPAAWTGPMMPDDVVTLQPIDYVRVWVAGQVRAPGYIKVPVGATPYDALAAAGDIALDQTLTREQYRIQVLHGDQNTEIPSNPVANFKPAALSSGDQILVLPENRIRVILNGDVNAPGQMLLPAGSSILNAIDAKGTPVDTSLATVYLVRGDKIQIFESPAATARENLAKQPLESNDTVFIPHLRRSYMVLGNAATTGRYSLPDDRETRLVDAIGLAHGVTSQGSNHHIYIIRGSETGKTNVSEYHLELFLKKGDISQNPIIRPGDLIYVDTPKGLTFATLLAGLSAAYYISLAKGL